MTTRSRVATDASFDVSGSSTDLISKQTKESNQESERVSNFMGTDSTSESKSTMIESSSNRGDNTREKVNTENESGKEQVSHNVGEVPFKSLLSFSPSSNSPSVRSPDMLENDAFGFFSGNKGGQNQIRRGRPIRNGRYQSTREQSISDRRPEGFVKNTTDGMLKRSYMTDNTMESGYNQSGNGFYRQRNLRGDYNRERNDKGDKQLRNIEHSSRHNDEPQFDEMSIDRSKMISMDDLRKKSASQLTKIAEEQSVGNIERLLKHDIICAILRNAFDNGFTITCSGIIEVLSEGFGFLRYVENNYNTSSDNIYISQQQVKSCNLRTGDSIQCYVRTPRKTEKYFAAIKVIQEDDGVEKGRGNRVHFDNLTPLYPREKLNLDINIGPKEDVSTRAIDLIAPIGKGQRALIVAPPRTGKTVMLQHVATAITTNHPEVFLIVLLIDERPEEVTDMRGSVKGEVISSTFDESADRHVEVADIVAERAKRLVEKGRDVIILLDSITRLARAYNTVAPSSGKILTGGIDANALQRPKRFFGAARNIDCGGSLTIIATALIDTGSKMDEVIFEEFKGRGNSELILDRSLADRRHFPAINVSKSGTRKEEEMIDSDTLSKRWALRRIATKMNDQGGGSIEAIEFLTKELKKSKNNTDFFIRMNSSSAS